MVGGVGGLQGTLAEYVVANADLLTLKPNSLSISLEFVLIEREHRVGVAL
jgi:NADPH:quinone reductase-like Zn-dependent oxidoreductase